MPPLEALNAADCRRSVHLPLWVNELLKGGKKDSSNDGLFNLIRCAHFRQHYVLRHIECGVWRGASVEKSVEIWNLKYSANTHIRFS